MINELGDLKKLKIFQSFLFSQIETNIELQLNILKLGDNYTMK